MGCWVRELLGRVKPRGRELINRLVGIVYDAKKSAVGEGAPRERTIGWLRRSLVEALSLAIQRGNADVMRTYCVACYPAGGVHQHQANAGGVVGAPGQPGAAAMAVALPVAAPLAAVAGGGVA